jgi:tRNA A-37 threonylcarbamoyl transferase component Bud32
MIANEDFLFTQEAMALGLVTDAQVKEAFALQKRMAEDLKLDERVSVILVKRGYMGEDQARRVYAKIEPKKGGTGEIQGYRLLEVVGRGAMGTVYRAIHLGLKREVALKILRQDLAGDRTQVERLRAEATMLASLDHPNIVRALDAGESNGFPYVAMEFVEGETLRDRLRREGALPEEEALRIARALADALERARRMGVVHRDVKPGNVLMAKNGTPKLMDLGLAKGPVDLGLTQHGATVGTPQYIAPEQAIDPKKADTRSDIYALGATLYAMLTGRPPFDGQTLAEILTKVLYETPPPVRAIRPEISLETGYLVERMMLRDPSLRYRTPALVAQDIDRLTQGASILPTGFSGNWEAYLLRKRVRALAVAGLAAALVAGGTWFAWSTIEGRRERQELSASLEKEIGGYLADRTMPDDHPTVGHRLSRARDLARRADELEPPSRGDLEARIDDLEREDARFRSVLDAQRRSEVEERRENYAAADAIYATLLGDPGLGSGPAQRAALALREKLGERSDDAMEAQRRKVLSVDVTSSSTLHILLGAWRKKVEGYASTKVRSQALHRATLAADAARLLAVAAASALADVGTARIRERVAAHEFAELEADLAAAQKRLQNALRDQKDPILELRGPTETQLAAMLRVPLDAARETAAQARREEVDRVLARAAEAFDRGQSTQALDLLADFAKPLRTVHPAEVQRVEEVFSAYDLQSRDRRDKTARALESLVEEFLEDLRAYDLPRMSARLAAARARKDVDLGPALDELDAYPARYEQFYVRALKGLATRIGPDKKNWLDRVELRDGTTARFWEVKDVSIDTRKFTIASHSGGLPGGTVQTHDVADLADAELWRLGALAGPPDPLLRALRGLAMLPPDSEPDFYRRGDALKAVVAAFEAGGVRDGVLSAWAAARLDVATKEAAAAEVLAADSLASARNKLATADYSSANYQLDQLKTTWRFTRVAKQNAAYVDDQLRRIRADLKLDEIATYLVVAKVERARGGDPDLPFVTIRLDFDAKEQLSNFDAGVARLERSPANPIVTPDPKLEDLRLLLLPDDAGVVVKDRPLSMRCPFDATGERSVSFALWPMTPVFLAIDLDGAQVGVLSVDPQNFGFASDVPALDGEKTRPPVNFYGRGRGVIFHPFAPKTGDRTLFGDPAAWPWEKDQVGRGVLNPRKREQYEKRLFAFGAGRDEKQPYRVTFVHNPETGRVALSVDGREVHAEQSDRWKAGAVKSTGRIQILTYTTCAIDDLAISGRISREWLDEMKAASEKRPTSGVNAPVAPRGPK